MTLGHHEDFLSGMLAFDVVYRDIRLLHHYVVFDVVIDIEVFYFDVRI